MLQELNWNGRITTALPRSPFLLLLLLLLLNAYHDVSSHNSPVLDAHNRKQADYLKRLRNKQDRELAAVCGSPPTAALKDSKWQKKKRTSQVLKEHASSTPSRLTTRSSQKQPPVAVTPLPSRQQEDSNSTESEQSGDVRAELVDTALNKDKTSDLSEQVLITPKTPGFSVPDVTSDLSDKEMASTKKKLLTAQVRALKQKLEEKNNQLEQQGRQLNSANESNERLVQVNEQLTKHNDTTEEIKKLTDHIGMLKTNLKSFQDANASYAAANKKMEAKIECLETKIKELETQIEGTKGQMTAGAPKNDEAVRTLQLELKDAFKDVEKFKQQNQDYFRQLGEYKVQVQDLEFNLAALREQSKSQPSSVMGPTMRRLRKLSRLSSSRLPSLRTNSRTSDLLLFLTQIPRLPLTWRNSRRSMVLW